MSDKILFVDDEQNLLDSYRRSLGRKFPLDTACGGPEALAAIAAKGPYAVVVSDLRMPGMDGIQVLSEIRARAPDTVRIMLTGGADVEAAVAAVNEGNLFRFLTKPCPPEQLAAALLAGIQQHRLVTAEKELLEKTLSGSVRVLTEVLALASPRAFGRAQRVRRIARQVAEHLGVAKPWQVELAAMLSQVGTVALPPELADKIEAGSPLDPVEQEQVDALPSVAANLIANIPRLEPIAKLIEQSRPNAPAPDDESLVKAGKALRAALLYDSQLARGAKPEQARQAVGKGLNRSDEISLSDALVGVDDGTAGATRPRMIAMRDLGLGMIFDDDLRTTWGMVLVSKGQEVTAPLLARLRAYAARGQVSEPFRVLAPV